VSGTITCAEPVTLDPAAVINVKLVDITLADAPEVIAQQAIIAGTGQFPFNLKSITIPGPSKTQ
jgi:uncharacterized lipoprotein YbaY